MALASRTALFALAITAALTVPATAERVELRDAVIGGLAAPLLVVEGARIDAEAIRTVFAGSDDTAAFLALSAERIEMPDLSGPGRSTSVAGLWTFSGVVIQGLEKGFAAELVARSASYGPPNGAPSGWRAAGLTLGKVELSAFLSGWAALADGDDMSPVPIVPFASTARVDSVAIAAEEVMAVPLGVEIATLDIDTTRSGDGSSLRLQARFSGLSINPASLPRAIAVPVDGSIAINWNWAARTLAVESLKVSSPDLGVINATARFGGTGPVFLQQYAINGVAALLELTLEEVSGSIEDKGLVAALLSEIAERQEKTPEDVRIEAAALSRIALPVLLTGLPDAERLAQGIAGFVEVPRNIAFTIKGRNGPLGIADFIAAEGPSDVLRTLAISITDQ